MRRGGDEMEGWRLVWLLGEMHVDMLRPRWQGGGYGEADVVLEISRACRLLLRKVIKWLEDAG